MGGGGSSGGGGCGAEGGDGGDVGRDERDAKSSKCRERKTLRECAGNKEEERVMMQEKCRKQAFKELRGGCK